MIVIWSYPTPEVARIVRELDDAAAAAARAWVEGKVHCHAVHRGIVQSDMSRLQRELTRVRAGGERRG